MFSCITSVKTFLANQGNCSTVRSMPKFCFILYAVWISYLEFLLENFILKVQSSVFNAYYLNKLNIT